MADKASEQKIVLTIDGKTVPIQSFSFSAQRGTNPEGFPSSTVSVSDLNFSFLYHEEMFDCWKSMMKEDDFIKGKVDFYSPLGKPGSPTKTFEFGGGKIIVYSESWSDQGESFVSITITAYEIKFGTAAKHTRHWPNYKGVKL